MTEHRLFDPADPPEWLDPTWWRDRDHCDHLGSPTGAHVARLHAAAQLAVKAAGPMPDLGYPVVQIVDLGAGDGALLQLIGRRPHAWGYDIIRADVKYAREVRDVEVHLRNVQQAIDDGGLSLGAPELQTSVVVLTEVLEHMADPHGFLAKLHARPEVRYVVASSPFQETPEQHEWNHAWAWDTIGYEHMFRAAGFEALELHPVEWSQLWLFEAVR
jgi:2-polyprenyl-3-methyl-5-hydroxy-6-metoxy-1,4-benzoquinol methylase